MKCQYCARLLPNCWCNVPGFVNYRGYTLATAIRSVGPGWTELIKDLFDAKPEETAVIQVKEKFGGLRFYTDGTTAEFLTLVDAAEEESYKICEQCGEPGSIDKNRYWLKTLCHSCTSKRDI